MNMELGSKNLNVKEPKDLPSLFHLISTCGLLVALPRVVKLGDMSM